MKTARTYEELMTRLDEMSGKAAERQVDKTDETKKKVEAYNTAFWEAMYTGMPQNALREGSDGSGGYLVPDTYDERLVQALTKKNVLRQIATTIPTTQKLTIPISLGGENATWMPENEAYSFSEAEFDEVVIDAHKLGTSILVSDEMLEDGGVDLEKYIEDIFAERISNEEESVFINGDGNGKPIGIIHQASIGKVTDEKGKISADDLVDMEFSLAEPYRKNAVWVMSNDAYCRLSQLRHYRGNPIWSSGFEEEMPMKLFGYPIYICDFMNNVVPGGIPVMFGDFSYYWIGDRGKRVIKRLVERYADRGQVAFITTERVDAKLVLPEAVKLLKVKSDKE
ncbi:MAG: phage major capsid protein [Clostridia bacterium]|nr:phage major capsid protein [Clostridia bacterium]